MIITNTLPGRSIQIEGKEWLYFSGTSYLGISQNKAFQNWVIEGLQKYGTHYGGSRLSNWQLGLFEQVETQLAALSGSEAALVVSSGTLAGQLVSKYFSTIGKNIFTPNTHPALWISPNEPTLKEKAWSKLLSQPPHKTTEEPVIIFSNAIDSLYAKQLSFDWLQNIHPDQKIILILDDSHGFGITGVNGGGIHSTLKLPENVELLVISSLGKAFGIPAGAIIGQKKRLEEIWKTPFFGGASPAPLPYLHAFIQAQELYIQQRQNLFNNIQYFIQKTAPTKLFQYIEDYPVFYTPKKEIADLLKQHQILISSFSYPTPADDPITRVVINSLHTKEDLFKIIELLSNSVLFQSII